MTKPSISKSGTPKAAKPKAISGRTTRRKTRQDQLKTLLSRKGGATVRNTQTAFGWQPHSVRATVCGLRKSDENIETIQVSGGTAYRIVSVGADK